MSLERKSLRCGKCGHKWQGLWEVGNSLQPRQVKLCPACQQPAGQSLESLELFSENAFRVEQEGEFICFKLPAETKDFIAPYAFTVRLPRHAAMTLSAWAALVADPSGEDFDWLLEEVRKRSARNAETTNEHQ